MAIRSCRGCVPPKRHPGCHDHCPDYLNEKAEYDAKRDADYKRRQLAMNLNEQRYKAITKAVKEKRPQKKGKQ